MDRRTFLGWVGVGMVASSLPIAIAACSSNSANSENSANKNTPASTARTDGFQTAGTVAELNQKGFIINKQLAAAPVIVIRDLNNNNNLAAVNAACTHKGCTVAWKADKKLFVCPCHDSEFSPDGKVVEGPADKPLPTYQAKIEGDAVLVKVS